MTCRIMIYVQHLLGVGHLKRGALLARGLAAAGFDVSVVLGGREVPGIDLEGCARILLPPAHVESADFGALLDEAGSPVDDAWRDRRTARLLFEFEALAPEVLIVELFPFGRRMFSFELLPLLTAARARRPRPRVLCSVRDILVRKTDAVRNQKVVAQADGLFDHILVHGDPRLVPIEASFPEIEAVRGKLSYTGYVFGETADDPALSPAPLGEGEVLVTVGGGAVGLPLLRAAIAARALGSLRDRPWRLLTGPNLPDAAYAELAWSAPSGVVVERWRSDLPALLSGCALSISQAGYNTVMDVLAAGARAVLVPFADGSETEQTLRAKLLAGRGRVVTLDASELSPENLAAAVERALTLPAVPVELDRSGVENTVRLVRKLCSVGARRHDTGDHDADRNDGDRNDADRA